ncbi:MAG: class I SAM-dependent methyltransferase [Acidobacteria bacterium]|nr:MAG: class I SAM-dependent methyltransferase [Acidobacteriota bacterium]
MLHALIEKLSDYPRFFLFCRGLLESNFRVIRQAIEEHLGPNPDRKVLDVACGPGAFSDLFSPGSYTGIDLNPKYIRYATKNYNGQFCVQDARALDFPEGAFDDVLVYGLLHHLNDEDVTSVLRGMQRVLRPGGRALVIEDIPTESRLNLVGHLLHWAENGHHIRPADDYRKLLMPHFRFEDEQLFRSGVCDYYMARLIPHENGSTNESSGS